MEESIASIRARFGMDDLREPIEINTAHKAWRGPKKESVWVGVILAAVIGLVAATLPRH